MKNIIKLGIVLIMLISSIIEVSAIGISPGTKTIKFDPGIKRMITIDIIKEEPEAIKAEILVKGELKDYIKLQQQIIELGPNENKKSFSYYITLPQNLPPGTKTAEIIFKELPREESGETLITTSIALIHELKVNVPYPGKYAEAEFNIKTSKNNARFYIRISNKGQENIKKTNAVITIYDKSNNPIKEITTDEIALQKNERKELIAEWDSEFSGTYIAKAKILYDKKQLNLEKAFTFGDFYIIPLGLQTESYNPLDISSLTLKVKNLAYEEIKDFTSKIILSDKNQDIEALSNPENIKGKEEKEIRLFLESQNLELKEYTGKLILEYSNKNKEYDIIADVKKDSIDFKIKGITKKEKTTEKQDTKKIIGMILLIISATITVIIYNKLHKITKKKGKKKSLNSRK